MTLSLAVSFDDHSPIVYGIYVSNGVQFDNWNLMDETVSDMVGVVSPPRALINTVQWLYFGLDEDGTFDLKSFYVTALKIDFIITVSGLDKELKEVVKVEVLLRANTVTYLPTPQFKNLTEVLVNATTTTDKFVMDNVVVNIHRK